MFDFGSGELLIIGVVALVVIGPKELPGLLRTVGQTVSRLRRMAGDFQGQFQDALQRAELQESVKSLSEIQSSVTAATNFNDPLAGLQMPFAQQPVTPPIELQSPTPVEVPSVTTPDTDTKPKKPRAKKVKPVEVAVQQDDPQAALFDTLDGMSKKAEAVSSPVEKPKTARAAKSVAAAQDAEAGDGAATKTKRAAKPAKPVTADEKPAAKAKRKTKTDEA